MSVYPGATNCRIESEGTLCKLRALSDMCSSPSVQWALEFHELYEMELLLWTALILQEGMFM